jgi:hydrogenase nickel incorporation protein HypB
MCTVCGCGESHQHDHPHDHGHHDHDHGHDGHHHHYGQGAAGLHVSGMSQERIVQLEQDILARNDGYAAQNRRFFRSRAILALNLVSSPGSGKTTLLERSLQYLHGRHPLGVIEGDQQTENDAERIRATGVAAVQINTGKGCHLDAHMVAHALESLPELDRGILFIENVGNLVCPALFDLGEAAKVAILSVTEGEDKPIKYPDMFHRAALVLVNKIDLLPYLKFDLEACLRYVKQVNPEAEIVRLSATSGEGIEGWYAWLEQRRRTVLAEQVARLERQMAALQGELASPP